MIEITFLGTSSMVPTKDRNHNSLLLNARGTYILVDCGEGTQRQLTYAGISASKINKILITHWHGDHVLGLPGLLQTLAAQSYQGTLEIYGPKGTEEKYKHLRKAFEFDSKGLDITVTDISKKGFYSNSSFTLEALQLDHDVPCLGYRYTEKDRRRITLSKAKKYGLKEGPLLGKLQDGKTVEHNGKKIKPDDVSYIVEGKKIAFILDTTPCKNAQILAQDVDVLVCESTYTSELQEKAEAYGHMTAQQAATLASTAHAEKLVLTHISARYKEANSIVDDAKMIFTNVTCAHDLLKIKV